MCGRMPILILLVNKIELFEDQKYDINKMVWALIMEYGEYSQKDKVIFTFKQNLYVGRVLVWH